MSDQPSISVRVAQEQRRKMNDTPLMAEARDLIEFYDARGKNWESALSFIMTRGWFGPGYSVIDNSTHFAMPKRHAKTHRQPLPDPPKEK
jgi:hypothetical protein